MVVGGCLPPAYVTSPEWRDGHFRNPGIAEVEPSSGEFFTRALRPSSRRRDADYHPPAVRNDGALLREGRPGSRVAWIGHATMLVQTAGWNVLTDPIFGDLPFIPRHAPPGIALADLPAVDVVLVSHDHRDHLDEDAVRALGGRPTYVVPLGIGHWLRGLGYRNVIELNWWQSTTLREDVTGRAPLTITLVPAQHWGLRGLLDQDRRLWGGFVVASAEHTIYVAGDTAYGPHFRQIAERSPRIDLAILPIGAYEPTALLHTRHESPEEAAKAFHDLGARWLVPMHWGTFRLAYEPMHEPPERLLAALGSDGRRAYVLPIGGLLELPRRRAAPSPAPPH